MYKILVDANVWIKYARAKEIAPLLDRFVTYHFLPIINNFPRIQRLIIEGILDMRHISNMANYANILVLELQVLEVGEAYCKSIHIFLHLFPNLEELILNPSSGGPINQQFLPLDVLFWKNLASVALSKFWISEDTFIDFITYHH